jgi:cytidylate kinase
MIITIDGPAGTGKTTVAKKVADQLGFFYFDTGAMYRALTYSLMKEGIPLKDTIALDVFLKSFHFDIQKKDGNKRYFVDGSDVTEVIRSPEVTKKVSEISAHPAVRETLVSIQRNFGKEGNSVFEGRDMGTIVFPQAELKVFLTARPAVRAERRYLELKPKLLETSTSDIMQELLERDHIDSTREASPLRQADDAHLIDTSDLAIDEVVTKILLLIPK